MDKSEEKKPEVKKGRPAGYKPEYCQILIDEMAKGLSFEAVAGVIDEPTSAMYRWVEMYPAFREAKEKAFRLNREFWERQGVDGLWQTPDGKKLNNTIWIFNMKNRFGWRDNREVTTNSTVTSVNVTAELAPKEKLRKVKEIAKILEAEIVEEEEHDED